MIKKYLIRIFIIAPIVMPVIFWSLVSGKDMPTSDLWESLTDLGGYDE